MGVKGLSKAFMPREPDTILVQIEVLTDNIINITLFNILTISACRN